MSQNSLDLANRIAGRAEEYGMVSENTPPSIAAGSIYLVVRLEKLPITKREIATACKISEVTICKCYKDCTSIKSICLINDTKKVCRPLSWRT